jgi:hypothetical protein
MIHERTLKKRKTSQGSQYAAEFGEIQRHLAAGPIREADKQPVAGLGLNFYTSQCMRDLYTSESIFDR